MTVVAVTGTTHALYVRRSDAPGYTNLGGYLLDPPAVARTADGTVYYIGRGLGDRLYIRTDRLGWQLLTPATFRCVQPGATAIGGSLQVGCRNLGNRLSTTYAEVRGGNLPATVLLGAIADLGGVISSGPGVWTPSPSEQQYYVTAPTSDAEGNNVWGYERGWVRQHRACTSQPAVSSNGSSVWFACRGPLGTLKFWRYGDDRVLDAGGIIVGTPGLAAHATGRTATAYVRGSNGCIYTTTLGLTSAAPWHCIGGVALGVGAATVVG